MIPLRINRLWPGCSLIVLLVMGVGLYHWRSSLIERLRHAAAVGNDARCVETGGRLPSLFFPDGDEAQLLAQCRRNLALGHWSKGNRQAALDLLERVVLSPQVTIEDRRLLSKWAGQQRYEAMDHYRKGDLDKAVAVLQQLSTVQEPLRDALISSWQMRWSRNRDLYAKATDLSAREQWWEALNAVNWLDHPWWRAQSQPLRRKIIVATERAAEREQHHGELPHTVPIDELDQLIHHHLVRGLDGWHAYRKACQELGGEVVQQGPESACRR